MHAAARLSSGALRTWRRISFGLAVIAVTASFAASFGTAKSLGLRENMPGWVIDAIPSALSESVFGHPQRYTSLTSVTRAFNSSGGSDAVQVNARIARVLQLDVWSAGGEYVLLGNDDKGIVDFVRMAFSTFGNEVQSVFYLYFAVLFTSVAAFALAFGTSGWALVFASSILLMESIVMPAIAFNGQLTSIFALRAFPLLSMMACLHCLFFLRQRSTTWLQSLLLAIQILVIFAVIHVRSTAMWQLAIVGMTSTWLVFQHLLQFSHLEDKRRSGMLSAVLPLLLIVMGLSGLHLYRNSAYPDEYQRGDQITTRVFWHNIYSGLAFSPKFAREQALHIDDVSIIRATGRYLGQNGRNKEWVHMGGETPGYAGIRWAEYDLAVRDMLLATCAKRIGDCLATVLWHKPTSLAGTLAWLFDLRPLPPSLDLFSSHDVGDDVKNQVIEATTRLDGRGLRRGPWSPLAMVILALFVPLLVVGASPVPWGTAFLLFSGSLIPVLAGYPAPHAIAEAAVSAGMLFHLALLFVIVAVVPSVWRRLRRLLH